jgi:hypothetical protein
VIIQGNKCGCRPWPVMTYPAAMSKAWQVSAMFLRQPRRAFFSCEQVVWHRLFFVMFLEQPRRASSNVNNS